MNVTVSLLGGFDLRRGSTAVALPPSAQRIVAFLALQDRPVRRVYVAGKLWLGSSEAQSLASLRSALWRLRRSGCDPVRATATWLTMADGVEVDVRDAVSRSRAALERPGDAGALADVDLANDLLPDWYDDWIDVERERLRQLRLHALEAIAEQLLVVGRYGQAVDACMIATRLDPLRESAQRLLMRIHLAEGNSLEAVRVYRRYARSLHVELQLAPSDQMRELAAAAGRP